MTETDDNENDGLSDKNNAAAEPFTVYVKGNDGTYQSETINTECVPAARLIQLAEDGNADGFVLEALSGENGTSVESFEHDQQIDLTEDNRTYFRTLPDTDYKA